MGGTILGKMWWSCVHITYFWPWSVLQCIVGFCECTGCSTACYSLDKGTKSVGVALKNTRVTEMSRILKWVNQTQLSESTLMNILLFLEWLIVNLIQFFQSGFLSNSFCPPPCWSVKLSFLFSISDSPKTKVTPNPLCLRACVSRLYSSHCSICSSKI